jgi:DNA-binding transcriptional ArsR family regulator
MAGDGDVDMAAMGQLLADRGRCRILLALADGRALPASVLASEAGVRASTASGHLRKTCRTRFDRGAADRTVPLLPATRPGGRRAGRDHRTARPDPAGALTTRRHPGAGTTTGQALL